VVGEVPAAGAAWSVLNCAVSVEFGGEVAYEDPTDTPYGQLHLVFEPLGEQASPWVRLGVERVGEVLYTRDGLGYRATGAGPYVVNSDFSFASSPAIDAGQCDQQIHLGTGLSLLIGSTLGLGQSSDRASLMSYTAQACEIRLPQGDDRIGINAIYGPYFELACSVDGAEAETDEVAGVAPMNVECELVTDGESLITSARWSWGDAEITEEIVGKHTYTRTDNYSLRVDAQIEDPRCGSSVFEVDRLNYFRVCADPEPSFRVERDVGLRFVLVNDSDVSTYGCHSNIRWEIFDEEGAAVESLTVWEPQVELPEDGRYRIVLTLSGPAGSTSEEMWFDTTDLPVRSFDVGCGCTQTPAPASWAMMGLFAVVTIRRRRR
ncbi:MAG: MYXO-CTERM sorting domain-containing protein, partial [Myxococcota bacterium]